MTRAAIAVVAVPIVIGLLTTTLGRAQSPAAPPPKFEVVSVRPCKDGGAPNGRSGGSASSSPGRVSWRCANVAAIIQSAYILYANDRLINSSLSDLLQPIEGAPGWVYSDRYDIEAKAEGTPADRMMMGPMFQALLEDRFQLKIHRETKEVPVYALTVPKSGSKLKPLEEGSCTPFDSTKPLMPPVPGQKRSCGFVQAGRNGPNMTLKAFGTRLGTFSGLLGNVLDRPVVDRTGITGMFDIQLEFAPDENTTGAFRGGDSTTPPPAAFPNDPTGGPSIFTAIQQQLGLKLEPAKGPHGFLVIDHVEKPSEN